MLVSISLAFWHVRSLAKGGNLESFEKLNGGKSFSEEVIPGREASGNTLKKTLCVRQHMRVHEPDVVVA